jgi:uncharacterized protein (DUF983 family)
MPEKNNFQMNPAEWNKEPEGQATVCWIKPGERLRAGMTCPRCQGAKLAYNGLLQLTCPACGLTETGACT